MPSLTASRSSSLAQPLRSRWFAAELDPFADLGYVPTERQAEFHAATEWDVLYGGAAGGGKTRALLMEGLRACVRHPGIKVLAIRESYPQLAESFLDELAKCSYAVALGASYNKTDHNLTFANGSVLRFRYCDGLEDARIRLGTEIQLLLVDEATQQDPAAIDFLCMRLRSSDPAVPVLGIRLGSNPGGSGHGWAKQRYVVATAVGERVYEDVVDDRPTGHLVRFIPARYTDNPHVGDYESVLDAVKDPRLRAAMRDGSWDIFAGQVFVEWRHDRHVIGPFDLPTSWHRLSGVDYGYAAPWCVEWIAVDPDRRVWVYRERYESGVGERDQARRILADEGGLDDEGRIAREPAERVRRMGDPSMWNKVGDANPVALTYQAEGVTLAKATNDRLGGVTRVHTYLAERPACPIHRAAGWTTCPGVHVFSTCTELIRTLPSLPSDPKRPEDVDTDAEDHCFVAGTLIATPHGERPIESLVPGDVVLVRDGTGLVVDSGPTRSAEVIDMVLSNGERLHCTPDHRFWTEERGWVNASRLTHSDTLLSCRPTPLSSLAPFRSSAGSGTTSAGSTSSTTASGSTERCGRQPTDPSRPVSRFTTITRTAVTTALRTLWRFRVVNIGPTTGVTQPTRRGGPAAATSLLHRQATRDSPVSNEHELPSKGGRTADLSRSVALTAVSRSTPSLGTPGSVRVTARWLPDAVARQTTRLVRARGAVLISPATGSCRREHARVHVVSSCAAPPETVYNLTVLGRPEFFANGILVHNCYDALRYALMALPALRAGYEPKVEPTTLAEMAHARIVRQARKTKRPHPTLGSY